MTGFTEFIYDKAPFKFLINRRHQAASAGSISLLHRDLYPRRRNLNDHAPQAQERQSNEDGMPQRRFPVAQASAGNCTWAQYR